MILSTDDLYDIATYIYTNQYIHTLELLMRVKELNIHNYYLITSVYILQFIQLVLDSRASHFNCSITEGDNIN